MASKDKQYQNAMKNSDEQEARTESECALQQVIFSYHVRQYGAV
ncbi:hypothetical protein ACJV2T_04435 [Gardnerella sp. Marseille-Q9179]|nr:hypothetical protein HMPREF1586_00745 [Gardnerella vaginalis JCP8522]EPI60145.1 hypothetical protein HMPREF1580_00580 [Gardnerella vaginalis JCP8070]